MDSVLKYFIAPVVAGFISGIILMFVGRLTNNNSNSSNEKNTFSQGKLYGIIICIVATLVSVTCCVILFSSDKNPQLVTVVTATPAATEIPTADTTDGTTTDPAASQSPAYPLIPAPVHPPIRSVVQEKLEKLSGSFIVLLLVGINAAVIVWWLKERRKSKKTVVIVTLIVSIIICFFVLNSGEELQSMSFSDILGILGIVISMILFCIDTNHSTRRMAISLIMLIIIFVIATIVLLIPRIDFNRDSFTPSTPTSTLTTTGVALEYPESGEFYETPIDMKVKASSKNGAIYLMPKPEAGNGHLGTVFHGESVQILAERDGYYFFQTEDGRQGWNWNEWFITPAPDSTAVSSKGVALEYPDSDEYYETPFSMKVKKSNSAIYLKPKPEEGNGNLGTVSGGETVQILAERDGYYFFQTEDGRYGWNWYTWFTS